MAMRDWKHRKATTTKVSVLIDGVVGPIFKKRGYYLAKLIYDWSQIVGSDIARHSDPDKIIMNHSEKSKTLLIKVDEANVAALIYFRKGVILEKIAQYFGYKIVVDLKVVQIHSRSNIKDDTYDVTTTISDDERRRISELQKQIIEIDDTELSAGLLELAIEIVRQK
jgi:hypothetical protein